MSAFMGFGDHKVYTVYRSCCIAVFNSRRSSHPRQKQIKGDISYKVMKMDPVDVLPGRNIMLMYEHTR